MTELLDQDFKADIITRLDLKEGNKLIMNKKIEDLKSKIETMKRCKWKF